MLSQRSLELKERLTTYQLLDRLGNLGGEMVNFDNKQHFNAQFLKYLIFPKIFDIFENFEVSISKSFEQSANNICYGNKEESQNELVQI